MFQQGEGGVHTYRIPALAVTKKGCLLYTSDAADERSSVDLGGRRIIKKKKKSITPRDTRTDVEDERRSSRS